MDSLTQLVLGASVGEAVLGKKAGNRAVLWGAIGGTIPDLDVLLNPLLSDVQSVLVHRTFSHSLFVLTALSPLLGYLIYRLYRRKVDASWKEWSWLFFASLITHPLLDAFTNYGTMLLFPFSETRIAWRTIFIIDPLYTLPLLIGTIVVLVSKREAVRNRANRLGLGLSSGYLVITVLVKLYVSQVVQEDLQQQGVTYEKFMTTPTFFNGLLYSVIVKEEEQYQVGYYSLLDSDQSLDYKIIPQQENLLTPYRNKGDAAEVIEDLITFTENFYALRSSEGSLFIDDLRFGIITGWFDLNGDYIFSFRIVEEDGQTQMERVGTTRSPEAKDIRRFWQRTLGNEADTAGHF